MISRYEDEQIKRVFSEANRIRLFLDIEKKATVFHDSEQEVHFNRVSLQKLISDMKEMEKQTKHETMAFVMALSEQLPSDNLLHKGLTSSDILDTCLAIQMRDACLILEEEVFVFLDTLRKFSSEHKYTPMVGRSHGKAGEVITVGLSFLSYYSEWKRTLMRLMYAREEISYGMMSGPMGNYSNLPVELEQDVCVDLGLKSEPISTQVIPRDRHAFLMSVLGLLGASLERISTHIRNLSQSGIEEVAESFSKGQTGSSAMPHKKNPILSENVSGLARLLKSYVSPSLDNVSLWYERDMSHSSVERVTIEDAFHLATFAVRRMTKVIKGLYVDEDNLKRNIEREGNSILSHTILCEMMSEGMSRNEAYRKVQEDNHSKKELDSSVKGILIDSEESIDLEKIDLIFSRTLGEF